MFLLIGIVIVAYVFITSYRLFRTAGDKIIEYDKSYRYQSTYCHNYYIEHLISSVISEL